MIIESLWQKGIVLKSTQYRTHRAACPKCANGKSRQHDHALAVTLNPDGAVWLCHRCGFKGGIRSQERLTHHRQHGRPSIPKVEDPTKALALNDRAQRLLSECQHPQKAGVVRTYLTERRRVIFPDHCLDIWEHPYCFNWRTKSYHPAMIAVATNIRTNQPQTLHFTFLQRDGLGKADLGKDTRLFMGGHSMKHTVVRLTPNEDVTMGLAIAEGIETALSAMTMGFSPVWACLSADNLTHFPVLNGIECLTVIADADENQRGQKAANTAVERWLDAGREVRRVLLPHGDLNDYLLDRS
jgi:hypothetical protein